MIRLSELDNGALATWDFSDKFNYNGVDSEFFTKYFLPYLNVGTKYGSKSAEKIDYPVYSIDGTLAISLATWYRLPDGTSITIFPGTTVDPTKYLWIFVDLNNSNKPNRLGKDIFVLDIQREKKLQFYHYGHLQKGLYACKKGTGQKYAGGYCGEWIQESGWEIPDGYPW